MRETEPTHWPQCHFSRWLTWFTNVCSDAQFSPFGLSIAFWESALFWDLFGRIQHAYVLLQQ